MNSSITRQRGNGIISELLKTPVFKDLLRSGARSLAHGDGGSLVREIMGQDPEAFLALAVSTPSAANILIRACAELGAQLKNQYPPELLASFLQSVLREVDTDSLGRCGQVWGELLASLLKASPETVGALADKAISAGPAWTARGIDSLAGALNRLEAEKPGTASSFLARALARIDRPAAASALGVVLGAVMDQKWNLFPWLFGFVRMRIRKRFMP
jgi:hypothetical protein